jgi:flagellar biosynthesis/type III secretory pathway protein FliH
VTARAWIRHGALHPDRRAPAYTSLDDAYDAGRRDGVAEAEARLADDRAAAALLMAKFDAALAVDLPSLAPMVEACILDLLSVLLGERRAAGEGVRARVEAALASLQASATATVHLNPADVALLRPAPPRVVPDPEMARGDVIVRCGDFELVDRLDARLARLR